MSEPLMTWVTYLIGVETGIWTSIPRAKVGSDLLIVQPASGMKVA
ncbi:MAG TPA: hypothetical protein VK638_55180 [Edaphobacter sp.]|nr:hypothetical protein [Edaphobacter sp.]